MKIDKKHSNYLFAAIMALMMSLAISLVMTFIAIGFISGFLEMWAMSSIIGFIVAYPISLVALPVAGRIVNMITE